MSTHTKRAKPEMALTVRPLRRQDWPLIERLFGERGACGGCWCMWPRLPRGGKLWEESKGEKNRRALRKLVTDKVHAVIAFAGDEPVGWCSFGPRQSFPRLARIKALQHVWGTGMWSVVCFYVASKWRRSGISTRLLEAATREALAQGATMIEGYPTDSKTGVVSASFAWMGLPGIFRANGYEETGRPTSSRRVYVKRRQAGKL